MIFGSLENVTANKILCHAAERHHCVFDKAAFLLQNCCDLDQFGCLGEMRCHPQPKPDTLFVPSMLQMPVALHPNRDATFATARFVGLRLGFHQYARGLIRFVPPLRELGASSSSEAPPSPERKQPRRPQPCRPPSTTGTRWRFQPASRPGRFPWEA